MLHLQQSSLILILPAGHALVSFSGRFYYPYWSLSSLSSATRVALDRGPFPASYWTHSVLPADGRHIILLSSGLRLADKRSLPCPNRATWLATRDQLYEDIMEKAWNKEGKFFGQSYEDNDVLDSAVLIMPLVFFMHAVAYSFFFWLDCRAYQLFFTL